jgi:colanic acid/amylovoran biosynthesis glycosyltransferase
MASPPLPIYTSMLQSHARTDSAQGPVVALWKDAWLYSSETFIQNQLLSLGRWRPVSVAIYRPEDCLPGSAPDFVGWRTPLPRKVGTAMGALVRFDPRYSRAIRTRHARLIHAHFLSCALQVLPVAKRMGIPLIVTAHGKDVTALPYLSSPSSRWLRRGLGELVDYAHSFLAVSRFIAERLSDLGVPEGKIVTNYIGIPLDAVARRDSRSGILFVGRLVEKKGADHLLSALAYLPPGARRDLRVRVVGDGPMLHRLDARAQQLGLHVEFLGYQPPAVVAALLSESAIFAGPSHTSSNGDAEGLGMVFLEAALHGIPCVAYRHGGVPEAVLHGVSGLLADEGDVRGLAENIGVLLEDAELRERLGDAARSHVSANFDIQVQTRRLEALYDSACRMSPSSNG